MQILHKNAIITKNWSKTKNKKKTMTVWHGRKKYVLALPVFDMLY